MSGEASPIELSNLEKCLSVIIDSLKMQNPLLVKAVEDLVSELCRITLLWDEMWLAALMQRQGEVHRLVNTYSTLRHTYMYSMACDNKAVPFPLPLPPSLLLSSLSAPVSDD